MKKLFFAAGALLFAAAVSAEPLWLRNSSISPSGTTIAFTYKGDIYTVLASGGNASRLTSIGYNTKPIWSPDGTKIAFASDREGSMDVYVMSAEGGNVTRLTTNSGKEEPRAWLGNDTVLFSTSMLPAPDAAQSAFGTQVYKVSASEPGRPVMFASWTMQAISVDKQGRILFQDKKGYEDVFRKHEHSSGTADIWLCDNGKFTKLTHTDVQNQNPVWAPQGAFYYTSEVGDGTMNIFRRSAVDANKDEQITRFKNHPVRSVSVADDGKLAFSWNGELYTLTPGSEPEKVEVNIVNDDYNRQLIRRMYRNGATCVSVSPNGKEVAFVVRGDVYVANVKYGTTKQITNTPEQERVVDFAPDGRTLVYDSERDGVWQLFTATIADKDEKQFAYATDIVETPLYKAADGSPAFQPDWSPDGKEIAFLENRTSLRVVDAKGKNVRTALDGKFNYSYTDGDISFEWSPDSRWFLIDYIGIGGWNNTDIALVKSDGSEVIDLTESGYSDGNARWALDGKAMIWSTDRNGYRSHGSWGSQRDAYIMFFDGDAYDRFRMTEEEVALADDAAKGDKKEEKKDDDDKDKESDKKKKVKPLEFDLDNAKYRVSRLTPGAGGLGDYLLSSKGDKFYYVSDGNLHEHNLKTGDSKVLAKGIYGPLETDAKGENIFVSGNDIKKVNLSNGKVDKVSFAADSEYRPFAEREYIYNHMLKQVKDKFYDPTLHGVDWEMYGEAYRRFLPHINNNYDFAELLSEILGELNASHTGGRYGGSGADRATAVLGAFYDENYSGDGLKIVEVIKRGPLDVKSADIKPGDIILAIDGQEIKAGQDYFPLLDGRAGKRTRLTVKRAKGGKTEDINVKPVSVGTQNNLLYRRWVERNQAVVDSVSDGRIAYIHIEGMNSPSFRTVFSELLGKYRNHDAVVVDTRYNGGGWLHNDIAVLLSGKEYVRFVPRGQYIGSEPFTRWTKPSVMLVNESNYSDAHGTPYTYRTLGLGEIVGAPIPGTMTAVWWENQIDPSIVFGIPQVTSMDMNGNVLENQQLNPDVIIYNKPEEVQRGYDAQLIGATKRLLENLPARK